jgi:hypothetical protein
MFLAVRALCWQTAFQRQIEPSTEAVAVEGRLLQWKADSTIGRPLGKFLWPCSGFVLRLGRYARASVSSYELQSALFCQYVFCVSVCESPCGCRVYVRVFLWFASAFVAVLFASGVSLYTESPSANKVERLFHMCLQLRSARSVRLQCADAHQARCVFSGWVCE